MADRPIRDNAELREEITFQMRRAQQEGHALVVIPNTRAREWRIFQMDPKALKRIPMVE